MSAPIYNVLLLSFSPYSHQRNFVPLYRRHPRIRLLAVADEADVDPALEALNRRWADELGIPYIVGVDRALEQAEIDIVSVGHEIERRTDLIQRSAAAGKHLWIDKFTGATPQECAQAAQAVRQAGVKSIVPSYAYGTLVRHSRALIERGALGDLLGLHIDVHFSKGWPTPLPDGLGQPPVSEAGRWKYPDIKRELLTVGSYAVGLMQTCLGPPSRVYGHGGAFFFPAHAAHQAEDFAALTFTDDGGRVSTLSCGRIGVATHAAGGPQRVFLNGTRGTAFIDAKRPAVDAYLRRDIANAAYLPDPADPMQWASGPPSLAAPLDDDVAGLAGALDDLVGALDEDRQPAYTADDAQTLMEILTAAYSAVARGQEIPLRTGTDAAVDIPT